MAKWCDYCTGNDPYYCAISGKSYRYYDIMVKNYCMNDGIDCTTLKRGYYISTVTGIILKKQVHDAILDNIKVLRDEYLEKDDKYKYMLEMYDIIGPSIASKIDEDQNKVETATKVYSILTRISTLVSKEEIDKATKYYSQMVGVLINKYNLGEFYEEAEEEIEKTKIANKVVKKHKIQAKTLD